MPDLNDLNKNKFNKDNKLSPTEYALLKKASLSYREALKTYATNPHDFYLTINCLREMTGAFRNLFDIVKGQLKKKRHSHKHLLSSCFSFLICNKTKAKTSNSENFKNKTTKEFNSDEAIIETIKQEFFSNTGSLFLEAFGKKNAKITNLIYSQTYNYKDYKNKTFLETKGKEEYQILFSDGSKLVLNNFVPRHLFQTLLEFNKKLEYLEEQKKEHPVINSLEKMEEQRLSLFMYVNGMKPEEILNKTKPNSNEIQSNKTEKQPYVVFSSKPSSLNLLPLEKSQSEKNAPAQAQEVELIELPQDNSYAKVL